MITVRCLQVESLTAARKSALNGQEPSDAIRVVNAFLTQIDQIKRYFKNKFSYDPASLPFSPKGSPVQIHVNFLTVHFLRQLCLRRKMFVLFKCHLVADKQGVNLSYHNQALAGVVSTI